VGRDLRDVPLAEPALLIVLEGLVGQQHPQHRGQVLDEPWRQAVKMGKGPEALKRFEEHDTTKRRHRRLRRTVDERQIVRARGVEFFQLLVTEVRTHPGIRRLMDRSHGLP